MDINNTVAHALGASALFCALLASPDAAAKTHPPESILAAANDYLRAYPFESDYPVEFRLSPLSSRLSVAQCEEPIDVRFGDNAKRYGKTHVLASCSGDKHWRINLGVDISLYHDTVTVQRPVARGTVIDASDLRIDKVLRSKIFTDFYSSKQNIVGLVAKMPLREGQIINSRLVSAADLIRKGQTVVLMARAGGIHINTKGKALGNAKRGELVRVKNNDSGRIVEGIASDIGKVEIPL